MKKFFRFLLFSAMLVFIFMLPFLSSPVKEAVISGMDICTKELIPSLFPFLFFSSLIYYYAGGLLSFIFSPLLCPLFKISKNACPAVVAGILGGFPSGAIIAAELFKEGKITKEEAERLPVFCSNSGLMFVIGTLGVGHFSSFRTGVLIYFFHIFASLAAGLLSAAERKKFIFNPVKTKSPVFMPFSEAFTKALSKALLSIALISGNFIIFRVLSFVFSVFFKDSFVKSFIFGLLEVTGGVLSMPGNNIGVILTLFLLSFNGICVYMQTLSVFAPLNLSVKKYISWKIFCAFLSSILMKLCLPDDSLSSGHFPSMLFYATALLIPVILIFSKQIKSRET